MKQNSNGSLARSRPNRRDRANKVRQSKTKNHSSLVVFCFYNIATFFSKKIFKIDIFSSAIVTNKFNYNWQLQKKLKA